jgi:hypothetical protein
MKLATVLDEVTKDPAKDSLIRFKLTDIDNW